MGELKDAVEAVRRLVDGYCTEKCVLKNCGACKLGEAKAKLEVLRALAEKYEGEVGRLEAQAGPIQAPEAGFRMDWDRLRSLPFRWGRRRGVKVLSFEDVKREYPELARELKDRGELAYKYTVIRYYPDSGTVVVAKK